MGAAKHTPGPWVADLGETYTVRAVDGRVAHCQHVHLSGRRSSDTVAANAHLIAAAPEMLEALEVAVNAAEAFQDGGDIAALMEFDAWLDKARAALAKAKGGEA